MTPPFRSIDLGGQFRGRWYRADDVDAALAKESRLLAQSLPRELREAWHNFGGELNHSGHCFRRTAAAGWSPGQDPVIVCECGLDRLEEAIENLVALADGRLIPAKEFDRELGPTA